MKRILALRHAKSVSRDEAATDALRALSAEGVSEVRSLVAVLRARGLRPDRIVCSDAARALETARILSEGLNGTLEPVVVAALYGGTGRQYLETLSGQPPTSDCAVLVGHNPSMEEMVALLVGRRVDLGTCWLADVAADVDSWRDLAAGPRCRLLAVITPTST